MQKVIPEPVPEDDVLLELGISLGQNQSYAAVAGRCSAAHAETLRRIREEKKYQKLEKHWRDFGPKYLKMSGTHADRLIGLLEEFGPCYFQLAQLTRISPETYRELQSSLSNGALCLNGEVLELIPENAPKIAAAVKDLRATAPTKKKKEIAAPELPDRLRQLETNCVAVVADFERSPAS